MGKPESRGGWGFRLEGVPGRGPAPWPLTRLLGRLSSGTAEGLKVQTERTRSMLLFANVSARHYGNYTCRAANRLGTSSASMRLLRASLRGGRGGAGPRGRGRGGGAAGSCRTLRCRSNATGPESHFFHRHSLSAHKGQGDSNALKRQGRSSRHGSVVNESD